MRRIGLNTKIIANQLAMRLPKAEVYAQATTKG
jgi:hypothetical protein